MKPTAEVMWEETICRSYGDDSFIVEDKRGILWAQERIRLLTEELQIASNKIRQLEDEMNV